MALPSLFTPVQPWTSYPRIRRAGFIASLTTTSLLAVLAPAIAAPATAASATTTFSLVSQYRAGMTAYTNSDGTSYAPDNELQPGGTLSTSDSSARAALGPLYATSRTGVSSYTIPVPAAGSYRVALRFVRCQASRCTVRAQRVDATAGATDKLTVTSSRTAALNGVAVICVWARGVPKAAQTSNHPPLLQPTGMFGADSVFDKNISTAPLASNSAAMVSNLVQQVTSRYNGVAALNAYQYNVNFYSASASQTTTNVGWTNCQHKPGTPAGMLGEGGQFVDVPIPANAVPATGTDASLTIYRPSTDQLWEFWKVHHDESGWHACWGGQMDNVSTNPGWFTHGFGSGATGLAGEGGDITISDAESGVINHAITLAIPAPANYKKFSWPAQRSDGTSEDPNAIPEGTRLRLDPSIDVDSLGLTPLATMIAKAAQTYGFILVNKSGCVAVTTESGIPMKNAIGVNPWNAILNGTRTSSVLKHFPWSSMQVLPQNYGK